MKAMRILFALVLALACGQAAALGLGEIKVKSGIHQPLLAEIPIISNDPAELQELQARLASPEIFARIGLEPPGGVVADLRFAVVRDDNGDLAVRVTSTLPIDQPMLNFLIEVEWGQGKLVREYSALIDVPRDVASPGAPLIDAPQTALADEVSRPDAASILAVPSELGPPQDRPAAPADNEEIGQEASAIANALDAPAPEAVAAPVPAEIAVAPPPPTPSPDEAATAMPAPVQDQLSVQSGDTLSEIALALKPRGTRLDQTMLALLRANPGAFIGNDINRLKSGAVLRVPESAEFVSLGSAEAAVVVRDKIEQWRQARREKVRAAEIAALASAEAAGKLPSASGTQGEGRVAGARLEIIPPTADDAVQAGTRSGASAGGEGDMLRQQQELQQTRETLAARDAEVQELKARLGDLEKLQQQQQQLITLKDSELATAQQRLAESNRGQSSATVAPASPGNPAVPTQAGGNTGLWLGGGLVLVLVGLIGWWLSRRNRSADLPRPSRPRTDSALLAASMPNARPSETSPLVFPDDVVQPQEVRGHGASAAAQPAIPAWMSTVVAPTWHGDATMPAAEPAGLRVGQERIELARAYIDLGDHDTARSLLQEIVQVGDPDTRTEAVRLLQDLPQ